MNLPKHLHYLETKEWWTSTEAARVLGLGREQVVNHLYSGELDGYDASARGSSRPYYLIYRDSVQRFFESRKVGPVGNGR